ncbi:MAG: hypothetical protein ACREH3_11050, partial [Geminicoccales bacterium]
MAMGPQTLAISNNLPVKKNRAQNRTRAPVSRIFPIQPSGVDEVTTKPLKHKAFCRSSVDRFTARFVGGPWGKGGLCID